MSATVLYMSMSLDGFIAGPNESLDIAGPNESLDNGLGDGGERLHEWASARVPIFILTCQEPYSFAAKWPLVTPVSDVTAAMTRAKGAAGGKSVLVHGAGTAPLALAAGVLDEIELHVIRCYSARAAVCPRACCRADRAEAHPDP